MDSISSFMRATHKWLALIVVLFFIWKLGTGMFLQLRKPVDWIQPPSQKGAGHKKYNPTATHQMVLEAAMSVPEANVKSWDDILLLDTRVKNGMTKVRTKDWYEVQVDTQTGEVLSHAQRYNDIIGGWHAGSAFGGPVLILFTALAVLTFILALTGTWLAITSTITRIQDWRNTKAAKALMAEQGIEPPAEEKQPFNIVQWAMKYHYYLALPVFIPWLFVSYSGIMLQLRDVRGEYPSVSDENASLATVVGTPEAFKPGSNLPLLTFKEALDISLTIPELQAKKYKHIWRVYTYPREGVMTFRTKRHVAIRAQIDASTGKLLHVGDFSSDFWEDWHQGFIYEVTGKRKEKGFSYNMVLNVFLYVHIISFIFWALGAIAVLKLTIFKPKD